MSRTLLKRYREREIEGQRKGETKQKRKKARERAIVYKGGGGTGVWPFYTHLK